MPLVNVYVLFNVTSGTDLTGQGVTATLNCERLNSFSPRQAWMKRQMNPGDGTVITNTPSSDPNDPEFDANTIQGFLIQQDDNTLFIDIANAAALTDACNECCGDVPAIATPFYTSGIPDVFAVPTLANYCIERADAGDGYAHQILGLDYVGQTVGNTRIADSDGEETHYQVQAFSAPVALGTDTVTAGAC